MLYDPKWEAPTKTDPLTLTSLVAWLEQQPGDREYCFADSGYCLLCQYFAAQGFENPLINTRDVDYGDWPNSRGRRFNLPPGFNAISQARPHTFGAALARARAAHASGS